MVQQAQLAPISAEELAKRSKLAIWQSLQRAGYNPQFSYLGRQLLDRSERLTPLAMAGLGNDANAVDKFGSFSDAYTNAMLKGGTGGGQFDLSRSGQRGLIDSAFQQATPGSDIYGFLTSGDPEEQFNRWRGFEQAAQSGRFAPLVEAGLANKQAEFTNFLGAQLSGQGNPNQNWIDVAMGRPGPSAYAGAPPPAGPSSATQSAVNPSGTNPNPSTAQASGPYARPTGPGQNPTAYGIGAAGPQGSLTPPISATQSVNPNLTTFPSAPGNPWEPTGPSAPGGNPYASTGSGQQTPTTLTTSPYAPLPGRTGPGAGTPGAGQYTYPENPNRPGAPNATPGAPGAPTSFRDLLARYQGDRQNWGTRGYRPNPGAFNIGGLSYNPAADQVTGYNNMSGQGRVTNRGNFFGQYLYTLSQYMAQRDRGGNPAIGLTANMSDEQVARLAAQRLSKNAIGSTGISGV